MRARAPGEGIAAPELVARIAALTAREPLAFPGGPELVRSVGIVSGGGARNVEDAIAAGLDAFITGEPAEWAAALAREARIHFVAAGHHATDAARGTDPRDDGGALGGERVHGGFVSFAGPVAPIQHPIGFCVNPLTVASGTHKLDVTL